MYPCSAHMSQAAFTIFEVILCIGLLSLLSGFVAPSLVQSLQQYGAKVASAEVAAMYTEARLLALSHGWDGVVDVIGDGHVVQLFLHHETQREYVMPAGVVLLPNPFVTHVAHNGSIQGDRSMQLNYSLGIVQISIQEGGVDVQ